MGREWVGKWGGRERVSGEGGSGWVGEWGGRERVVG